MAGFKAAENTGNMKNITQKATEKDGDIALSVTNVSVSYGDKEAVRDVSLSLQKGMTFGLIGLNGAGKTTLIKTILGLRKQGRGDIFVFGNDAAVRESKKKLVYLPERFDPPWFLTGEEFLRFSASLYENKLSQEVMEEKARALALDPAVLKNRVQTYSKGMRQKLGLMATLLSGCDLLILDEPMSGLDPQARACVKKELCAVKKNGGTVFLSSHILSDMDEICDDVAILHKGGLLYNGSPAGLKSEQGESRMEAAFLKAVGLAGEVAA